MKNLINHLNENLQQHNFVFKGNLKQSPYKEIDLGLSVKWCSCNVGAKSPEDPGLLFQWGRTDGYKFWDDNHEFLSLQDYITALGIEYKHGKTLKPEDDAAHVNMKGGWRMPTKEEIDELLKLKHEWTELNGVEGYEFTSENGNSIFIPAAGLFNGNEGSFEYGGFLGSIWSSSVVSGGPFNAYYLLFDSGACGPSISRRCFGFSVRGVC